MPVTDSSNATDSTDASSSQQDSQSEPTASSHFALGVTLAIVGTFLFALKSIFIKLCYAEGATAMDVLVLRMVLSLPFYVAVLVYDWTRKPSADEAMGVRKILFAVVLGFLGYYLASFLDLRGLELISAQLERLTLFTYPAMIAVLAWMFLGERLTKRIVLSIGLCYLGIFLMYARESMVSDATDVRWGVAFVVGAAVSYSAYVVLAKGLMQRMGSRRFTSLAMLGSTFFVICHFLATESVAAFHPVPKVWAYCGLLAVVCTVVPSFLINESIVRIGATRTTVIGTVGPVMTMMLAIFILAEPTSLQHLIGMVIVICGVVLVSRSDDGGRNRE